MKREYWSIIRPFIPSILLGFGFMGLVLWLKPSIYWLLGVVALTTAFFSFRSGKPLGVVLLNVFINSLFLLGVYGLWRLLGVKGVVGLVVACVVVALIIIFRRWKLFINTIKEIEKILGIDKK